MTTQTAHLKSNNILNLWNSFDTFFYFLFFLGYFSFLCVFYFYICLSSPMFEREYVLKLHPTQVAGVTESSVRALVDQCVEMGWAIGEVGLDYYRGKGWGTGFGGNLPAGDPTHCSCFSSPSCAFRPAGTGAYDGLPCPIGAVKGPLVGALVSSLLFRWSLTGWWVVGQRRKNFRGCGEFRLLGCWWRQMVLTSGWPWRNDPRPYRADVPPCGGGLRGGSPALVERVRENFQSLFG